MFLETGHTYKNYKEEIEALNTKVTKSHPMLSLNHKAIVTRFCESNDFTYLFRKGFVENK